MEVIQIVALPGFLGQSQDWQSVQKAAQEQLQKSQRREVLQLKWWTPELFSKTGTEWNLSSLNNLSEQLLQTIKRIQYRKIFIGYSLGGRIGLHMLEKAQEEFEHFIFLSTHSGLQSESEKKTRLEQDESWAQIIQNEPWTDFLNKWNQQSVFGAEKIVERREAEFSKKFLAEAMRNLSLARQKNFNHEMQQMKYKISWGVGKNDLKFLNLANTLVREGILDEKKELNAGHRVLFESPSEVAEIIVKVLLEIT